jgi:hypothetical protein
VSDLQFGPRAADDRPIFRPIGLECLGSHEPQGREHATTGGLLLSLAGDLPIAGESRHAIV